MACLHPKIETLYVGSNALNQGKAVTYWCPECEAQFEVRRGTTVIVEDVQDVEVVLNPVEEEVGLIVRLPTGEVLLEVRQNGYVLVEDLRAEKEEEHG